MQAAPAAAVRVRAAAIQPARTPAIRVRAAAIQPARTPAIRARAAAIQPARTPAIRAGRSFLSVSPTATCSLDTRRAGAITERVLPHGVEYARAPANRKGAPPSRRRHIIAGRRLVESLPGFLVWCRLATVMA